MAVHEKRSKLFYKARERIIDEIATRMVCEMISDDSDGLKLPRSWVQEADQRAQNLVNELSEEFVREDEEVKEQFHPTARR